MFIYLFSPLTSAVIESIIPKRNYTFHIHLKVEMSHNVIYTDFLSKQNLKLACLCEKLHYY